MKTKILLWIVFGIAMNSVAADPSTKTNDPDQAPASGQSSSIVLSDGTKLTLLGVTYGRHHVPPNSQPTMGAVFSGNGIDTPTNDSTVVWIEAEHEPSRWPNYQLLVSDIANTACVNSEKTTSSHVKDGVDIQGFTLRAFPRWDKVMILRAAVYRGEVSKEHFLVANPQPGFFGNAKSEPLPSTKSDGDFEVTLTRLVAGAPLPPYVRPKDTLPSDLQYQCVRIAFDFKQNGRSVTNWNPWLVETSDAAGNHVQTTLQYQDNEFMRQHMIRPAEHAINYTTNDDYKGYYYKPGLWPDEPAWKVRLEFTRTSGFDDDEIVTFTNLPVIPGTQQDFEDQWSRDESKTNFSFIAQGQANGVQMKVLPPSLAPNSSQPGQKYISVIIYTDSNRLPPGMNLKVLQATDDQGREIGSPFSPAWAGHFSLEFPNVQDVKTLNLKLALHKSRFVEFNVKPTRE